MNAETTPSTGESTPTPRPARRGLREQFRDLGARVQALPERTRWAVYALAALVGWLAVDDLLWSPARAWSAEGDRIEAALARGRGPSLEVPTDVRRAIATFGPVEPPEEAGRGRERLSESINEVAKRHKVAGYSFETRIGPRLKDADAITLGPAVDRLQAELKFETTAEELPRIIADLESQPDIELVSSLRITRNEQSRKIGVQATIEAWTLAQGGRRGR
jgi:hypothetical protein